MDSSGFCKFKFWGGCILILRRNLKKIVSISAILIMLLICLYSPITVANADYIDSSLITVIYFERIEGTPFATRVQRQVRVPVKENHKIEIKDVANKLGNQVYGVLNSYCERFEYVPGGDYYMAQYENSVYLNAKTTDGNFNHYFLNINNTFYDYYAQFVKTSERIELWRTYYDYEINSIRKNASSIIRPIDPGIDPSLRGGSFGMDGYDGIWKNDNNSNIKILTIDLFSWYWNKIHLKYPQLNGIKSTELYGYWGFVPIPHSNSINDLLERNIFGFDTTFNGVLEDFKYEEVLSKEAYQSLLEDYGYVWIERAWAEVANAFGAGREADFYMFYASGETNIAFIAENGATNINDNRTGTVIKAEETFKDVVKSLKDAFSGDKAKKIIGVVIFLAVMIFIVTLVSRIIIAVLSAKKDK